jgi:hypothetical protein
MAVVITKDKIQAYEDVRKSGVTNMFAVDTVMSMTDLTREEIKDIMQNYSKYINKFGIKR